LYEIFVPTVDNSPICAKTIFDILSKICHRLGIKRFILKSSESGCIITQYRVGTLNEVLVEEDGIWLIEETDMSFEEMRNIEYASQFTGDDMDYRDVEETNAEAEEDDDTPEYDFSDYDDDAADDADQDWCEDEVADD
jgi:hypothetical protein